MSEAITMPCCFCGRPVSIEWDMGAIETEAVCLLGEMSDDIAAELSRLRAENERLRVALLDSLSSLVAAHSLLSRGGKKGAPSDKMFAQMLSDYSASITRARAALAETAQESER